MGVNCATRGQIRLQATCRQSKVNNACSVAETGTASDVVPNQLQHAEDQWSHPHKVNPTLVLADPGPVLQAAPTPDYLEQGPHAAYIPHHSA